jgi:carbohydrate diacid regulator
VVGGQAAATGGPSAEELDLLAAALAEHQLPDTPGAKAALSRLARAVAQAGGSDDDARPTPQELRDRFVYELLLGGQRDESATLRQAEILGMDLHRPRAVLLVHLSPPPRTSARDWGEAVIRGIVRFFHLPSDTICGYLGAQEVVVLKASSTADLAPWACPRLDRDPRACWANLAALKRAAAELADHLAHVLRARVNLGVGRYHPGLSGLSHSYDDARAALSLGRRYMPGRAVYALDELGLAAWVGILDEPTRLDLASLLVGPLDDRADLLETLEVFFAENGSVAASAVRLAIHRNTLAYRLDRVLQVTGLDPRRFDDAVQLRLALLLRPARAAAQEIRSA